MCFDAPPAFGRIFWLAVVWCWPLTASAQATISAENLWGEWKNTEQAHDLLLVINEDGTGEFDNFDITWSLNGSRLTIAMDEEAVGYEVTVEKGHLWLSDSEDGTALKFNRVNPDLTQYPTDMRLLGVWSDGKEMIAFKRDGQCTYGGNSLGYSVVKNRILLRTPQGTLQIEFKVSSTELTLKTDNRPHVYRKVASGK